jgi:hypothetical protein
MSNKKNDDADSLVAKSLKPGWERHVPLMSTVISLIDAVEPLVQTVVTRGSALFAAVPENVVPLVVGLALCFFGGIYTLTIAAVQAFRISGWDSAKTHAMELYEEWKVHFEHEILHVSQCMIHFNSTADPRGHETRC